MRIRDWSADVCSSDLARHIPEPLVRLIAGIPEDHALYLAKTYMRDEEVEAGTAIDLDAPGLERLYSQGRQWKFNVQGVLLKLGMPTIVVKDALTQAGFDTAQDRKSTRLNSSH